MRQDGQLIHQGIPSSSTGSLTFTAEGGGSFGIQSTDESNPPPAGVSDLRVTATTQTSVTVAWTAVGADGTSGQASIYDLRYATTTINGGNWSSATQAQGEPAPKASGQGETFTISGLAAGTTYYVALRVGDEVPYWSAISNVASGATLPPPDTTPPAAVTNLAAGTVTQTSVALTWSAVGDDGMTGRAATYDIRYATAPITGANWDAASQASGEPTPKTTGQSESFTVSGLTAGTLYYFAMKVSDEVPNTSGISNVASKTTLPPPDTTAPAAVSTLATSAPTTTTIRLTWTAVGDDGLVGRASSYDIRYSTSMITPGKWATATRATGEQTPQTAGQPEMFTVAGLQPGATYYFAMTVADEVPNTSGISNVATGTTLPPDTSAPSAVTDLAAASPTPQSITLTWTAVGDDGMTGQAALYDLRYATFAITSSNWTSATQVAGEPSPQISGAAESLTISQLDSDRRYYFALKVQDEASNLSPLSNVATAKTQPAPDAAAPRPVTDLRSGQIGNHSIELLWTAPSDDSLSERVASYEGRFTTGSMTAGTWSSAQAIEGLPTPAQPGQPQQFTLTGLAPGVSYSIAIRARDEIGHLADLGTVLQAATTSAPDSLPPDRITDLTVTEVTTSTIAIRWHAPADHVPEDCTETPEVSRYEIRFGPVSLEGAGWESGTVYGSAPQPAVPGTAEEIIISGLLASTRYFIAVRSCDTHDNCSEISNQVQQSTRDPEQLPDTNPPGQIRNLAAGTRGTGAVLLTWTAPGGDGDQGTADHYDIRRHGEPITLETWDLATPVTATKPCAPAGQNESYEVEGLAPETTYHFALLAFDASGNQGPISPSVSATTAAPPDTTSPAAVVDLRATSVDTTSVVLEWTAPGDDRGDCESYELRASTTAIDPSTWEDAAIVPGVPAPGSAGSPASFRVRDLSPATEYHFAIRSWDSSGNVSPLSNVEHAMTDTIPVPPDTTPPAVVADLQAVSLSSTQVLLSWSAVGDDGLIGRAASYQVRRSTGPIDTSNWASATELTVDIVPGEPGTGESLTVSDLAPATTHHFAVRVADEAGNLSAVSPDVSTTTPPTPDTSPPATPMGLSATVDGDHVHLYWYASPEPDVVEYTLYRRAAEGSGVEPLTIPGIHELTYEDDTLLPETDYFYSIAARDGSGNPSSYSAEITVRLPLTGFLPIVTGYSAEASVTMIGSGRQGRVRLHWQATVVAHFEEFAVDRSNDNGSTWSRRGEGVFTASDGHQFEENVERGAYLYRIAAVSPEGYELTFTPITVRVTGRPIRHNVEGPFPNPSDGPLQITFTLAEDARVQVLAYDLEGRLCGTLRDDRASAGVHPWSYDPQVLRDGALASGVYFIRIMINGEQTVRKFVLEK